MMKNSPNATKYRNAKKIAKELYENDVTDTKSLSRQVGVREATIKKWIKVEKWIPKSESTKYLQEEIDALADKALKTALQAYITDPTNKDLQSLRGMLKEYMENRKPDRKILEYIIKFQDEVINFCLDTGNDVLRQHYQASLVDFSEWLRKKYVSI